MTEKTLLCQMLLDNSIIPSTTVTADHFTDHRCVKAFNEIQRQYTLHGGATKDCLLDIGLDYEWVMEVVNATPAAANYGFFQAKLKTAHKSAFQKRIVAMAQDMIDGHTDGDVIEYLEREITGYSADLGEYRSKGIKEVIREGIDEIERRYHTRGELPGISTGISSLDACLLGFQDRQYYTVGARPSDGKTAIALNFMVNAAKLGNSVGFISAESSTKEISKRLMARDARIDASRLSLGMITPVDFDGLSESAGRLMGYDIEIYDEPTPKIETVERKAREWKRRNGMKILFIDYIQYISGGEGNNNHEKKADISKRLKKLARELEIPVIGLAQLKNSAAGRQPSMADIAETDGVARDADGIVLIYHNRDEETNEIIDSWLIVDKSRDGKKGRAAIKFEGQFLNFKDV